MEPSPFLFTFFGTDKPPISDIEIFTEKYPWCAIGHKLLFAALCAQGNEAYVTHLPKTAVYVYNRSELYAMAQTSPLESLPVQIPVPEPVETLLELAPDPAPEALSKSLEQRVAVAEKGGDYFNSADFNVMPLDENNPIDRFIILKPKMPKAQLLPQNDRVSLLDVSDDDFMTETWAKIYVDQSLYQLAREAYKKLILLYPKKSDYFAALIQEIKLNANR
ncbi:MAG: hypothetical protein FWG54_02460 [Bacteroidetes bacterium]|nr:hypothetical protein [Bacteroidota bacterium]